jgi:predicted nucleic acid-binding protein
VGALTSVVGERVYLDANIFIYAIEEVEPWADVTRRLLAAIDAGECMAVTSELSLAECLVKPFELGRADLMEIYLSLLQNRRSLTVVPLSREILIEAARLRAIARIKLPDALHAATARQQGCTVFLTNDGRLTTVPGVARARLRDLS